MDRARASKVYDAAKVIVSNISRYGASVNRCRVKVYDAATITTRILCNGRVDDCRPAKVGNAAGVTTAIPISRYGAVVDCRRAEVRDAAAITTRILRNVAVANRRRAEVCDAAAITTRILPYRAIADCQSCRLIVFDAPCIATIGRAILNG